MPCQHSVVGLHRTQPADFHRSGGDSRQFPNPSPQRQSLLDLLTDVFNIRGPLTGSHYVLVLWNDELRSVKSTEYV